MLAVSASLALLGASGTGFAADKGDVPVDIATRDRIFQQILDLPIPGLDSLSVGLDPVGQKIVVTIFAPDGLPAVALGRLTFGDNVTVDVVQAEGPGPHTNVSGGEALMPVEPDGKVSTCTAGFAVGVSSGISGFLTAGHCFDPDEPADEQEAFAGGQDPVQIFGLEKVYGKSDWGIYVFDVFPDRDHALPEIVTDDGILPVRGMVQPAVGMPVCKHGVNTGTTCGTVTSLEVKTIYPAVRESGRVIRPKAELEGLVQTNVCDESGDSGGPVYTTVDGKTMAVGIVSGGVKVVGTGKCLETAGLPNVNYVVPLSATSAKGTDPSAPVYLKVAP